MIKKANIGGGMHQENSALCKIVEMPIEHSQNNNFPIASFEEESKYGPGASGLKWLNYESLM